MKEQEILLDVTELSVKFHTREGVVHAVENVNFTLNKGEILALVGESGCGKSVTANTIMGLIGRKKHEKVSGSVSFHGDDLLKKSERQMQRIRGNQISMIFQDPMTSLDPLMQIGAQVGEVLEIHEPIKKKNAVEKAVEMLKTVGIPSAADRAKDYPYQFSGGMRQRSIIAASMMCSPEMIIADEPTTALDVTIQAQILKLLAKLRRERNVAILLITHDLGVVAELCDRVAVMYAGEIVETAPVKELYANPCHPYTKGLMDCLPVLGSRKRLEPIPGQPPKLISPPPGCKFKDRCKYACEGCEKPQSLAETGEGHRTACWKWRECHE
ncbi:ATP-binding cassette domain-containing protein [Clostridium sp. MCC353]|uniref:ABC transporter ATP-binding protein n=1 Tax=Clostridium sp. MCC353 TaxID=2592646 RepID=UPI001C030B76|nr:ABC transporter ATP-binding protein [Clostridium sp. MCC353]MBT9778938.1 ATP-binding cassette domain-containing protein [Clostridium sp. MCC353]